MQETEHSESPDVADAELTTDELLSHLETGLWTAVVLIPILYYVNGPSVSRDQFVVRTALAVIVYLGAPLIRLYRWKRGRSAVESD